MKTSWLLGASVLALGAGGLASPAMAQETDGEDEVARQDVVTVTATRRAGTVQDVPINVAAVGAAQIEEQGLDELSDLIAFVPGINIVDRGARQGNPIIVRGLNADPIGSGDGDNSGGGTVATYLGEVPLFIDLKLNDMERVEVLLGPQGTLYGAGTLAGAIRYIPVKPQFDETMLEARTDIYQYSEADSLSYDTGFTFNHSIGDRFAIRGSIDYLDDSGFVDQPYLLREIGVSNPDPDFSDPADVSANLRSAEDIDTEEAVSGRFAARWMPVDWIDGTLTYYFQDVDVGGRRISSQRATYPGAGPEIFSAGAFENGKRVPEPNEISNELLALEVVADLGFAELTSATGFSKFEDDGQRDQNDLLVSLEYSYELFPAFGSFTHEVGETETFTQELRLVSTTDSRFNWIVGGFYSQQESVATSKEFTPGYPDYAGFVTPRPDALEYFSIGHNELTESALFGEVGYEFTDKLTVTVGGRYYEYELLDGAITERYYPSGDPDEPNTTTVFFPLFEPLDFESISLNQIKGLPYDPFLTQEDDGFLYKFNVAYDVTDDFLAYFTVSEGYRTGASNGIGACGAFDSTANQGACALAPGQQYGPNPEDIAQFDERQFGPDKTRNYEIGAKTAWLGGDLILNGAVFYVEWTDPQVASATVNANIPITVNAAGAESKGVELQGSWRVTDQFNLRGTYSYAKTELTEDVPFLIRTITPPGFDTAFEDGEVGDRLPGSPESQFSVFGKYEVPLENGNSLLFDASYAWQDDVLTRTGGRGSSVSIPSYGVANAKATYQAEDWSVSFYVNNLFDEYIETGIVGTPLSNQIVSDENGDPVTVRTHYATLGPPRTIGVRAKIRFGS
ncbi:TonB-dependent receptor [Henriciella sp.]|uniref:TonB-dependent receptor n=1 Tax=Henriciella sp. TaxID=1968823 RepID=UPI0026381C7B|nr:TonB-dependent receptor [Henriciella sp.]